ncbi:MAG: phage integrase N-terminal SAM-like domain-containing protein [Planctomycetota bacterium]
MRELFSHSIVNTQKGGDLGEKLLQQVRDRIQLKHMSKRTEEAYVRWIQDYLRYHKDRAGEWVHPDHLNNPEINDYLTYLAVDRKLAASSQNQALSAILFLYTQILEKSIEIDAERAKVPGKLPVVLSVNEVRLLFQKMPRGTKRLMAELMYGAGLRVMECCRLRVKDIDFERLQIAVREGRGEGTKWGGTKWGHPNISVAVSPRIRSISK